MSSQMNDEAADDDEDDDDDDDDDDEDDEEGETDSFPSKTKGPIQLSTTSGE